MNKPNPCPACTAGITRDMITRFSLPDDPDTAICLAGMAGCVALGAEKAQDFLCSACAAQLKETIAVLLRLVEAMKPEPAK